MSLFVAIQMHYVLASSSPRRLELLRRLNQLPGATEKLVQMRGDLLVEMRNNPELARVAVQHIMAAKPGYVGTPL